VKAERGERGFTAVEWTIGLGLLLMPVAILVLTIGTWGERTNVARLIAQEAARAVVLADDWQSGTGAALALADEIAANHGLGEIACAGAGCMTVSIAGTLGNELVRGNEVIVTVAVPIPAVAIPLIPERWTEMTYTAEHTERVDDFRSLP
jgi:hypothetical protein